MLYHHYELQRLALTPMRVAAGSALSLLDMPENPLRETAAGRFTAAVLDSFEHMTRRFGKPRFGLAETIVDGQTVAVTEKTVLDLPWCALKHFSREMPAGRHRRPDPKVLMVAPMSGHYATLLRGTVEAFLPDHDVYITDWRDARDVPCGRARLRPRRLHRLHHRLPAHAGPETHVIAVCQPAVPVLAAVALMNACDKTRRPAAQHDADRRPDRHARGADRGQQLRQAAQPRLVPAQRHPPRCRSATRASMRLVYPGFLQLAGFLAMNLDRHVERALADVPASRAGRRREPRRPSGRFYEEYRAVMDLPADFYLQTIAHGLPRASAAARPVHAPRPTGRSGAIERTAMLTIEGERDDISGLGQTRAAHKLCRTPARRRSASTGSSRASAITACSTAGASATRSRRASRRSFMPR